MPTAITATAFGLVKYNTISMLITMNDTTCTQTNADIKTTSGFAALPANTAGTGVVATAAQQLLTFLTTATYANDDAAETAFRAIGGEITIRQTGGTATSAIKLKWTASTSTASLTYVGVGSDNVLEVKIMVPVTQIQ